VGQLHHIATAKVSNGATRLTTHGNLSPMNTNGNGNATPSDGSLLGQHLNPFGTGDRSLKVVLPRSWNSKKDHESIVLIGLEQASMTVHDPPQSAKQLVVPTNHHRRIRHGREVGEPGDFGQQDHHSLPFPGAPLKHSGQPLRTGACRAVGTLDLGDVGEVGRPALQTPQV
jgi:hypothetical protein